MASNLFGPLADLEPSLWALSHAVATIVEKIQRPYRQSYKQVLLHPVKPEDPVKSFWRKSDSQGEQQCRLDRTEIVRFKIEELRRLSSPSHPLCFRCGDCGHRASDCRNAVLCYACNRLGHRSSRCRAVIERPPHIPPKLDLTVKPQPQPLIPPDVGSGSDQQSIPIYYEVSIMDSIKRLETELAEIKQELVLMKKRRSEIGDNRLQQQNGGQSTVTSPGEAAGTKAIQEVPVTPVGQGSWLSQSVRTKFKKAQSGELSRVAVSREKRNVHFKRAATKGTKREEMRG